MEEIPLWNQALIAQSGKSDSRCRSGKRSLDRGGLAGKSVAESWLRLWHHPEEVAHQ
jgi:hypothetical protein